jgi:hypothetical protein
LEENEFSRKNIEIIIIIRISEELSWKVLVNITPTRPKNGRII